MGESVVRSRRTSRAVSSLSRSRHPHPHPARIHVRRRRIPHQQTSRPQGRQRRSKVSSRMSERWRVRGFRCRKVVMKHEKQCENGHKRKRSQVTPQQVHTIAPPLRRNNVYITLYIDSMCRFHVMGLESTCCAMRSRDPVCGVHGPT